MIGRVPLIAAPEIPVGKMVADSSTSIAKLAPRCEVRAQGLRPEASVPLLRWPLPMADSLLRWLGHVSLRGDATSALSWPFFLLRC
jgi:hypothetical protein